jgi:hypothetical protein
VSHQDKADSKCSEGTKALEEKSNECMIWEIPRENDFPKMQYTLEIEVAVNLEWLPWIVETLSDPGLVKLFLCEK